MTAAILKAHFDGEHIQLDEPCELAKGTKLFITVVTPEMEAEREDYFRVASHGLAGAYGPVEPVYTEADFIEEEAENLGSHLANVL